MYHYPGEGLSLLGGPYYRAARVMIHENYNGDLDEYFLVEYHNATEFNKNYSNYDEYGLTSQYNTGVLIWHIRELFDEIDQFDDNLIDLEIAQPYNGWNNQAIPNDNYPRDYVRDADWNANHAGNFDYLDDLQTESYAPWDRDVFSFIPDGGTHQWAYTTNPPYNWYPPAPEWFYRPMSMSSDFFTNRIVKGQVSNKFTDATHPSSRDWAGNLTHISINNIRESYGSALIDIDFNHLDGPPAPPHDLTFSWDNDHPHLEWIPKREPDFVQYNIYKKKGVSNYQLLTSTTNHTYTDLTETKFTPGGTKVYVYYKITAVYNPSVETDFSNEVSGAVNDNEESFGKQIGTIEDQLKGIPSTFNLAQNYPNPFNPTTNVQYALPMDSFVDIKIYDVLGNEIKNLLSEFRPAGFYNLKISMNNYPGGVYILSVKTQNFAKSVKMILMK